MNLTSSKVLVVALALAVAGGVASLAYTNKSVTKGVENTGTFPGSQKVTVGECS